MWSDQCTLSWCFSYNWWDDVIQKDLHVKTTDFSMVLPFHSCHPRHFVRAIPFSQCLRLWRLCSKEENFQSRCAGTKRQTNSKRLPYYPYQSTRFLRAHVPIHCNMLEDQRIWTEFHTSLDTIPVISLLVDGCSNICLSSTSALGWRRLFLILPLLVRETVATSVICLCLQKSLSSLSMHLWNQVVILAKAANYARRISKRQQCFKV